MKRLLMIIAVIVLFISGCTHLGPKTVARDRFDYNTAISNSWKEQTLLNIVKFRYIDMPLFIDVASIASGYNLQGPGNPANTPSEEGAVQGDFFSLGSSGTFTDRSTITYRPITGQEFNKSFMTPIPPMAILFLVQTGWPADLIYKITVDSVNGWRGRVYAGANARLGDPQYFRMVKLMQQIQKSGSLGMRVIKDKSNKDNTVMFFHRANIPQEIDDAREELVTLLGLQPGLQDVNVVYGLIPKDDTEMAMLTRSMLQIMIELAGQLDVPEKHITEGLTVPSITLGGHQPDYLIKINHSTEYPDYAFAAVKYRDYWYYIDDRDIISKRTFTFLMILFAIMTP